VVNTLPVRSSRLPLSRLVRLPLPERPDGHLRQLQRGATSAPPVRSTRSTATDGGSPSRSTSCSHPIARTSPGRTLAIRLTTMQAGISEAGRRGSLSPPCSSSAGGTCRQHMVRPGGRRGCCHSPGHPSPVREHAPVVPGCGYRVSD
jgi:hypothetical protein